jgi:NitT/TauT family transport system substrate-binding protein
MNLLRISATSHGINYLPEYAAKASGAFAARGLEIAAVARDPWTGTLDDLAAGEADLVLGGVWVPAMYAGMGRDLVAVGQLNARFPAAIVTREPVEDFSWEWLAGRTVLAPGAGGTAPYEFTAGVMREHGVDPSTIRFVRDLSTTMLRELFEHGLGDAMIADPLTASELELAGLGHAACRLAAVAGPMPNSVYYTDRSRLDELHESCVALMGGIQDAMRDLCAGADPTDVIDAEWPDGPREALMATAATLATDGTWSGVRIEPDALERWCAILRDRGLMASSASFAELVDARVVDALGPDGGARTGVGRGSGGADA